MTIRRVISLGLAGVLLLACSESKPAHSAASESTEAPPPPSPSTSDDEDCAVTASGKCFATSTEACAALACPAEKCQLAYSHPAEVTCK